MINQVITSILDNDLYKFTMLNAVLKTYPNTPVEYTFHNRDKREFTREIVNQIRVQVDLMRHIHLTQIEEMYLRKELSTLFDEDFYEYLRNFEFNPDNVSILYYEGSVSIQIKGTWENAILWEVPLMAIISQVYFEANNPNTSLSQFKLDTAAKGKLIHSEGLNVVEFGTRRRFSKLAQSLAISILKINKGISATSNMYFGMIHNLPVKGTTAHEWIMAHGAMAGYEKANTLALEAWRKVYGTKLKMALTDTYSSKVFFKNFGKYEAIALDGLRQDSGDPIVYTDMALQYYQDNNIPGRNKTIMYSDSLNVEKAIVINNYRKGEILKVYGMGTFLTNDIEGIKPLNMVIKLSSFDGKPTVKISDDLGKNTGDSQEIINCKIELNL